MWSAINQGVQAVEGKTGRVRRTLIDFSIARSLHDHDFGNGNYDNDIMAMIMVIMVMMEIMVMMAMMVIMATMKKTKLQWN